MSTGLSSLAKLPEITVAYPFAGMEVIFSIGMLAFFVLFFVWQIAMEYSHHKEIIGSSQVRGSIGCRARTCRIADDDDNDERRPAFPIVPAGVLATIPCSERPQLHRRPSAKHGTSSLMS